MSNRRCPVCGCGMSLTSLNVLVCDFCGLTCFPDRYQHINKKERVADVIERLRAIVMCPEDDPAKKTIPEYMYRLPQSVHHALAAAFALLCDAYPDAYALVLDMDKADKEVEKKEVDNAC